MALVLNIDTAVSAASVCLAKDGKLLSVTRNDHQKDHAAWLHVAIKEIFDTNHLEMTSIDALGVTAGPGSYTGLRIGMATAKGICYALNKPLITLNTLLVMAYAAKDEKTDLVCPMIDARRMEVFTALYTKELHQVKEPIAITLTENSFENELLTNTICFFGNGAEKLCKIINHKRAVFSNIGFDASSMAQLSETRFQEKDFADLAYVEPIYLKEFYTPTG
jgi:tRNA threonylcarbamoyladenosine biosynthesis protein TsaB